MALLSAHSSEPSIFFDLSTMEKSIVEDILRKMQKPASLLLDSVRKKVPESSPRRETDSEADEYVPIGVEGLLSATEKLLAVNRELDKPDQRDSLIFKRFMTTDKLLAERVKMDADKTRMRILPMLAKQRSFRNLTPYAFDNYTTGYLLGNPLSSPLEEINPMHLVEQTRRVTQMGPGGIGTDNAITEDMQSVNPDQFGFVSSIEGPECLVGESEVLTLRGWTRWDSVTEDDLFACRVDGVLQYHKADRLVKSKYSGYLISTESETMKMQVTPNHRILIQLDSGKEVVRTAEEVFGKSVHIPIKHKPYVGDVSMTQFELPPVTKGSNAQRDLGPFAIGDWCEFMGWWLAEGNLGEQLCITQCPIANPDKHEQIVNLVRRMGLVGKKFSGTCEKFAFQQKQLLSYFKPYKGYGCYHKWIPEELFEAPIDARARLLDALLKGDGRHNIKRMCYCSVSNRLAEDVQRLAVSLGYTAFIRTEQDKREHVKTTNYVVSIHRQKSRQPTKASWRRIPFDGDVYCATVPGGFLHVRGKQSNSGYWTGNSERIGIDGRMAWGTKIGSDGKPYQVVYDRKRKKHRWVSPSDLSNSIVKLPD